MCDKTPAAQNQRLKQNKNKTKLKINQPKTVRSSSRGNQNFEAARCYKARKNAVQRSSRSNQNFEAARCYKTRKANIGIVKGPTPNTKPSHPKRMPSRTPTKHIGDKEQISTQPKGHKVQIPCTRIFIFGSLLHSSCRWRISKIATHIRMEDPLKSRMGSMLSLIHI